MLDHYFDSELFQLNMGMSEHVLVGVWTCVQCLQIRV